MNEIINIEKLDIGVEGIFDVGALSNFLNGYFPKIVGLLDARKLVPIALNKTDFNQAAGLLGKRSSYDLSYFTVVSPEYLDGYMKDYLVTLREAIRVILSPVDGLPVMLTTLEKWAANVVSTPDFLNKVWMLDPYRDDKEVAYHIKTVATFFNQSAGNGVDNKPFLKVYKSMEEYKEVVTVLADIETLSLNALDGKMSAKATSVTNLIAKINSDEKLRTALSNVPAEKLKPVLDRVIAAAKNMEFLAILLYNAKTAAYAYSETVKKVNKNL